MRSSAAGKVLLVTGLLLAGCEAPASPRINVNLSDEPIEQNATLSLLACPSVPEFADTSAAVAAWSAATGVPMTTTPRVEGDWVGCDIAIRLGACQERQGGCASAMQPGLLAEVQLVPGLYEFDARSIVMHELGHVFGASHEDGTLMDPSYHRWMLDMSCPDVATLGMVVEARVLDVGVIAPCDIPTDSDA